MLADSPLHVKRRFADVTTATRRAGDDVDGSRWPLHEHAALQTQRGVGQAHKAVLDARRWRCLSAGARLRENHKVAVTVWRAPQQKSVDRRTAPDGVALAYVNEVCALADMPREWSAQQLRRNLIKKTLQLLLVEELAPCRPPRRIRRGIERRSVYCSGSLCSFRAAPLSHSITFF